MAEAKAERERQEAERKRLKVERRVYLKARQVSIALYPTPAKRKQPARTTITPTTKKTNTKKTNTKNTNTKNKKSKRRWVVAAKSAEVPGATVHGLGDVDEHQLGLAHLAVAVDPRAVARELRPPVAPRPGEGLPGAHPRALGPRREPPG